MAPKSTENYIVTGLITNQRCEPQRGFTVRAFDRNPKTPDKILGESVTYATGRYKISFTEKDFKIGGGESGPNVLIRVFDGDRLLGESPVKRNAKRQITIDLQLDNATDVDPK